MGKKSKGRIEKFNRDTQVVDFKRVQKEKAKKEKAERKARKAALKREMAASDAEIKHDKRINKKKRRKHLIAAAVLVVLALIVGFSAYNIVNLKMEQKSLLSEQAKLQKQKTSLKSELKTVNDPDYVEQQARKQLKLVMPGEILYVLPKDKSGSKSSGN